MWREISARAWERKKEIAFFYPFEYYYYSVVFSQKSHQSVFSSVKVFCCCCCCSLKSGSIKIKIKCKKKAPNKKIVTKKKAKRHSLRAPFLNFGLLAKDTTERAKVAASKRPAALARFWHKFVREEQKAFAVRGFFYYRARRDRKTPDRTSRLSLATFRLSFRPLDGWIDLSWRKTLSARRALGIEEALLA